jgi:hypothetical protein
VELLRSMISRPVADSLNRTVKRVQAARAGGALLPGTARHEMLRRGFAHPVVFAPLPSERKADAVIPVSDRVATAYFLDHLVRRNSRAVRASIAVARLALKLGWLPRLVPYQYLVFRLSGVAAPDGRRRP